MSVTYQNTNDIYQTPVFDPFPEPNTIPPGWDLNWLNKDSESTLDEPIDELADIECFLHREKDTETIVFNLHST